MGPSDHVVIKTLYSLQAWLPISQLGSHQTAKLPMGMEQAEQVEEGVEGLLYEEKAKKSTR